METEDDGPGLFLRPPPPVLLRFVERNMQKYEVFFRKPERIIRDLLEPYYYLCFGKTFLAFVKIKNLLFFCDFFPGGGGGECGPR